MSASPLLEVRNITQQFPAVRALEDVTLSFQAGTVHGLIGENGAGKSTLMRVLAGLQKPTSGEILLEGKPVVLDSVRTAEKHGIVMIHQELNLVDHLSVAENVFLGREPRRGMLVDRAAMRRQTEKRLTEVGAAVTPDMRVGDLSLATKQLVEIAKAISHQARVIIMDEPTAVLSQTEVESLFRLVRQLRDQGICVIYISHILTELLALCDDIAILRDGKRVDVVRSQETTPESLAKLMVGREIGDFYPPKPPTPTAPATLEVKNLTVPGRVHGVSFDIRPGEIVGLAGLIGAGRTEVAEALVGLRKHHGEIIRSGHALRIHSPAQAMAEKIAYISEDRKDAGLVLTMSSTENVTLARLKEFAGLTVNRRKQRSTAEEWVRKLDIRVGDLEEPVGRLSGGNQQKIAVAKWLETSPEVLILDEPTRGVDVGAKREIYNLIVELAAEGLACLVISSEMTELIGLCHRILVLRGGTIAGEVTQESMSEENIMRLAAGLAAAEAR